MNNLAQLFRLLRDIFVLWVDRNLDEMKIGGPGRYVQIDESLFG